MAILKDTIITYSSPNSALKIISGTTNERPIGITLGNIRYNTSLKTLEIQNSSGSWDYYPNIVTQNLQLYLNPGEPNSYISGSSTWSDMSGNSRTATWSVAPTYSTNNGGILIANGSTQYATTGSFLNYQNFTITLAVNCGSTQVAYADIFDNNHTGTQNFVLQQNNTNLNQYSFGCMSASQSSTTEFFTLNANTWYILTLIFNGDKSILYINNQRRSSGASIGSINYVSPNFNIGRWNSGGRYWNGSYGPILVYNRVLSEIEILQNFEALRGRFGI